MSDRSASPSHAESARGGVAKPWDALGRAAAASAVGDSGDSADSDSRLEFLTCVLAGAPYAVPVERVREIVRLRTVTPMPRTPDWLRGVISLRGEVVQVVDLRMRLGLACSEPTRKSRIIVLHGDEEDHLAGVLVDAVREVLRVAPDAICPSTSSDLMAVQEMCRNGDEFVSILDLERALEPHGEV